jgi:hypothetical protein
MLARESEETTTKKCNTCNTIKPLSEFGKGRGHKGGHRGKCKECCILVAKQRTKTLKSLGLCVVCGKNSTVLGLTQCVNCSDKHKLHLKKHKKKKIAEGRCAHCGQGKATNGTQYCEKCLEMYRHTGHHRREEFSIKVGTYFNHVCAVCNWYSTNYEAFDVHHCNPNEKDYLISSMVYKDWEAEVVPELEKCVYVCSRCHRQLHAGRFNEDLASGELILTPGKVEPHQRLKVVGE